MPAVFAVIIVIALAIKSFADTSIFGIHRDMDIKQIIFEMKSRGLNCHRDFREEEGIECFDDDQNYFVSIDDDSVTFSCLMFDGCVSDLTSKDVADMLVDAGKAQQFKRFDNRWCVVEGYPEEVVLCVYDPWIWFPWNFPSITLFYNRPENGLKFDL